MLRGQYGLHLLYFMFYHWMLLPFSSNTNMIVLAATLISTYLLYCNFGCLSQRHNDAGEDLPTRDILNMIFMEFPVRQTCVRKQIRRLILFFRASSCSA